LNLIMKERVYTILLKNSKYKSRKRSERSVFCLYKPL
jgi:hypothetical protein